MYHSLIYSVLHTITSMVHPTYAAKGPTSTLSLPLNSLNLSASLSSFLLLTINLSNRPLAPNLIFVIMSPAWPLVRSSGPSGSSSLTYRSLFKKLNCPSLAGLLRHDDDVRMKRRSNFEAAKVSAALSADVSVDAVATVRGLDQGDEVFSVGGRLYL